MIDTLTSNKILLQILISMYKQNLNLIKISQKVRDIDLSVTNIYGIEIKDISDMIKVNSKDVQQIFVLYKDKKYIGTFNLTSYKDMYYHAELLGMKDNDEEILDKNMQKIKDIFEETFLGDYFSVNVR